MSKLAKEFILQNLIIKTRLRVNFSKICTIPCNLIITLLLFLIFVKAINGKYTRWTTWTQCSKTCGGGVRERYRSCTNPAPFGKGKNCNRFGKPRAVEKCNTKKCPKGKKRGRSGAPILIFFVLNLTSFSWVLIGYEVAWLWLIVYLTCANGRVLADLTLKGRF